MTGMTMATAGCVTPRATPLVFSVILTGGTSFNVAGASGSLAGVAAIGSAISGGTPPYSPSVSAVKDAGTGSVGIGPYGDGSHQTPTWSGMVVGQSLAFHLEADATDSGTPAQHASDRYPENPGEVILITRTS